MHLLGKIKQFEGVHELGGDPFEVGTVWMVRDCRKKISVTYDV